MKRRLRATTPTFVISLTALFVALGGTTYAATSLPKNSVGTKQLKKNAVTGPKIANSAVTAAKIDTNGLTVPNALHAMSADSATSATSAAHAASADSATSATLATTASNAAHATSADSATNASSAASPGVLGSGKTETGFVNAAAPEGGGGAYLASEISFPFPLSTAPAEQVILPGSPTRECPGSSDNPTAAPGNLCLYQIEVFNNTAGRIFFDTVTRWGASIFAPEPAGSSYGLFEGSWAVTAP